jgi:hypothetical protein
LHPRGWGVAEDRRADGRARGAEGVEEFEREHGLDVEQGEDPVAPSVQATCPATFGNADIFGIAIDDPTP